MMVKALSSEPSGDAFFVSLEAYDSSLTQILWEFESG